MWYADSRGEWCSQLLQKLSFYPGRQSHQKCWGDRQFTEYIRVLIRNEFLSSSSTEHIIVGTEVNWWYILAWANTGVMFRNIQEVSVQAGDRLELQLVAADDKSRCAFPSPVSLEDLGPWMSPVELERWPKSCKAGVWGPWSCHSDGWMELPPAVWAFPASGGERDMDFTRVYLGGEGRKSKMVSSQEVSTSFWISFPVLLTC